MDLKSKENQSKFVNDNFENLLQNINDTYGPILVEELKNRISHTIEEFNDEMTLAFDQLKNKESKRQKMYDMIKDGNIPKNDSNKNKEEISDWEKKINEIESEK